MTITPGINGYQYCICVCGICIFFAIMDLVWYHTVVLCIASLAFLPISFYFTISTLRTFVFNEDGCTVCFLWYKKHYRWSEMKIKQYVQYEGRLKNAAVTRVAEFCPKDVYIPHHVDTVSYCRRFHPLCFIYVSFPKVAFRNLPWYKKEDYRIFYEADEETFRAKLLEWGVEMEQIERGNYAKK